MRFTYVTSIVLFVAAGVVIGYTIGRASMLNNLDSAMDLVVQSVISKSNITSTIPIATTTASFPSPDSGFAANPTSSRSDPSKDFKTNNRIESQQPSSTIRTLPRLIQATYRTGKKTIGVFLSSAILIPKNRRLLLTSINSLSFIAIRDHHRKSLNQTRDHAFDDVTGEFIPPHPTVLEKNEIVVEMKDYRNGSIDWFKDIESPCTIIDRVTFVVGTESHSTKSECLDTNLLGGRITYRISMAFYDLTDRIIDSIKRFSGQGGDRIGIKLGMKSNFISEVEKESINFEIDLKTLAAGIMSRVIGGRSLPEPLHSDEAWNRDSLGQSGTMSICLSNIRSPSPYLREMIRYHKRTGISHVYVGVETHNPFADKNLMSTIAARLKPYIDSGFVTLVDVMYPQELIVYRGKPYFLEPCYSHARQFDTFVAIHDVDEIFVILDPKKHGESIPAYLLSLVRSGNFTVYSDIGEEADDWFPMRVGVKRDTDLRNYCQILLGATTLRFIQGSNRTNIVAEDFPFRKSRFSYFSDTSYIKGIALTRNTLTVEIHKHTNCELYDPKKKAMVVRSSSPYKLRIMPNPAEILVFHHYDFYRGGVDMRRSAHQPSEYALYYYTKETESTRRRLMRRMGYYENALSRKRQRHAL